MNLTARSMGDRHLSPSIPCCYLQRARFGVLYRAFRATCEEETVWESQGSLRSFYSWGQPVKWRHSGLAWWLIALYLPGPEMPRYLPGGSSETCFSCQRFNRRFRSKSGVRSLVKGCPTERVTKISWHDDYHPPTL